MSHEGDSVVVSVSSFLSALFFERVCERERGREGKRVCAWSESGGEEEEGGRRRGERNRVLI
jgi:hypothetical protein